MGAARHLTAGIGSIDEAHHTLGVIIPAAKSQFAGASLMSVSDQPFQEVNHARAEVSGVTAQDGYLVLDIRTAAHTDVPQFADKLEVGIGVEGPTFIRGAP